jgi:hypothetical protein
LIFEYPFLLKGAKTTFSLPYRATKNILITEEDLRCRPKMERVAVGTIQHADHAIIMVYAEKLHNFAEGEK